MLDGMGIVSHLKHWRNTLQLSNIHWYHSDTCFISSKTGICKITTVGLLLNQNLQGNKPLFKLGTMYIKQWNWNLWKQHSPRCLNKRHTSHGMLTYQSKTAIVYLKMPSDNFLLQCSSNTSRSVISRNPVYRGSAMAPKFSISKKNSKT